MIDAIWLLPIGMLSFLIGMLFATKMEYNNWRDQCITRNLMAYDPKTGKLDWIEHDPS